MIAGYVLGITCIPKILKQDKALLYSGILGVVLSVLILCTEGYLSVLLLALLGLANALVWPAIWPLALADLGKFTKPGASMLIIWVLPEAH